ncbi:hypothetical protein SLS54_008031 [Diplodia seriata]
MANRPQPLDSKVLTISDLKAEADKKLPRTISEYFNHGADDMTTLHDNEAAYTRYKLRPRILRNVGAIDTSTTIFGVKASIASATPIPLGFAPCAAQKLAHADGENGVSRAAARHGLAMCLSSWANTELGEVAAQSERGEREHGEQSAHGGGGGGNPYVMQVSLLNDKRSARRILRRAEAAGYKAAFLTVDLPVLGNRLNEARNGFEMPRELGFPNLEARAGEDEEEEEEGVPAVENGAGYGEGVSVVGCLCETDGWLDQTIEWETVVPWLREQTSMEIWLKGVYTPEDVLLAIRHKLDGVVISNHGGRQLDGVPATLDALRECAPVAKGKIGIAVDGGIRRGSDIFKALALGADYCFVGRYNGEAGVDLAIKILMREFKATMALTGCKSVDEICRSHLSILKPDGVLAKL